MGFAMAIDGPAGAGKSTIAKLVAAKLNLTYIDTGAMYRAVGYYMTNNNIDTDNPEKVSEACNNIDITIEYENGVQQIILNDVNITAHLREEIVGINASKVAKYQAVREKLVDIQRKLAGTKRVVMDGRDIGTCVLPNAEIKIYLTASVDVRANRRYDELTKNNIECDYEAIKNDIATRDYEDMHREISPLKQADDAILVDTSDMNIDQVVAKIISIYEDANI
ncbi:MAG: (d)CMP kinase [Lachnospiraceae bacterium]|nr:(d)CMP kinase [Lachnospiraceae bacterium]